MINGDDIVKWLGFGIDHPEFQKEMQQLSLKLQGTDSEYYNTHLILRKSTACDLSCLN